MQIPWQKNYSSNNHKNSYLYYPDGVQGHLHQHCLYWSSPRWKEDRLDVLKEKLYHCQAIKCKQMARVNGSEQDGWRCCSSMRPCEMDKMEEWWRANQSSAFTEMSHSNANRPLQLERASRGAELSRQLKSLSVFIHISQCDYMTAALGP